VAPESLDVSVVRSEIAMCCVLRPFADIEKPISIGFEDDSAAAEGGSTDERRAQSIGFGATSRA
jgi:hypothetical protein